MFSTDPQLHKVIITLSMGGRIIFAETLSNRTLLQFREHCKIYNFCNYNKTAEQIHLKIRRRDFKKYKEKKAQIVFAKFQISKSITVQIQLTIQRIFSDFINIMKILISILLISLSFAQLKINIDSLISINNAQKVSLPLSCSGSSGKVQYQVKGLPRGLLYQNGVIEGQSEALLGYYPVLINAEDESKSSGSQITVFKVVPVPKQQQEAKLNSTQSNKSQNNQTVQKGKQKVGQEVKSKIQEKDEKQKKNVSIKGVTNQITIQQTKLGSSSSQNQERKQEPQVKSSISTFSDALKNKQLVLAEGAKQSKAIQILQKKHLNPMNTSRNISLTIQPPQSVQSILNKYAPQEIGNLNSSSMKTTDRLIYNTNQLPKYIPLFFPSITPSLKKKSSQNLKSSEILDRQMNANKEIANILNLIDQLSFSLSSARSNLPILEESLKNATNSLKLAQSKVNRAEIQRSRLKTGLRNLNLKEENIKKELLELQEKVRGKKEEEIKKKKKVQFNWQQVKRLEETLRQAQLSSSKAKQSNLRLQNETKNIQLEIEKIQTDIQNVKIEVKNVGRLDLNIERASKMIKESDEQIKDLKQKLNAAVDKKNMAERQQKRLRMLKENTPRIISELQAQKFRKDSELQILAEKRTILSKELANSSITIEDTNLAIIRLRNQSFEISTDLNLIAGNIQYQQQLMGKKQNEIEEILRNAQILARQIQFYDNTIESAYEDSNESNSKFERAKQTLNVFIRKWQSDRKNLKDANEKLEKVKKQKERADRDMQQLMKQKSDQIVFERIDSQKQIIYPGILDIDRSEGDKLKNEEEKTIRQSGISNVRIVEDVKKS